jgi:hypothetical protein
MDNLLPGEHAGADEFRPWSSTAARPVDAAATQELPRPGREIQQVRAARSLPLEHGGPLANWATSGRPGSGQMLGIGATAFLASAGVFEEKIF